MEYVSRSMYVSKLIRFWLQMRMKILRELATTNGLLFIFQHLLIDMLMDRPTHQLSLFVRHLYMGTSELEASI